MHVGDQRLQRFADGELEGANEEAVRRHIESCPVCARRLDEIGRAGAEYATYHSALKASDPAPPRDWADLRPMLAAPPAQRGRWRTWGAVAAAVVVAAAGLYYRMAGPAPVSAAELLRKAAAVELPKSPPRRIRVRSAKGVTVRPAVLRADASGEIAALFLAARFSWEDPFSARSFAAWRDSLPEKRDSVRQSEDRYEIETTASSGPLESATLVLDARDLHPVRETLQFTTDRIEITEAEAAPPAVKPVLPGAPGMRPEAPRAGASAELQAVVALHNIDADLGEPVRVTREGWSVVVSGIGLTPARERQVREAVEGIPGVVYRSETVDAGPEEAPPARRPMPRADAPSRLVGRLGEDGVNRILDASEAVMARVYALRGLSRRFPQAREAQLADADRDVLASLRGEHVSGIRRHLHALEAALAPLLGERTAAAAPAAVSWQERAERIFGAARTVDQLLNRALAGGGDLADGSAELTAALGRLEAEAAAEDRP
jgi:hypothetical protein